MCKTLALRWRGKEEKGSKRGRGAGVFIGKPRALNGTSVSEVLSGLLLVDCLIVHYSRLVFATSGINSTPAGTSHSTVIDKA